MERIPSPIFAYQERGVFPETYQLVLPTDLLRPITVLSTTPIYTNSFLDTSNHTSYISTHPSKSHRQQDSGVSPEVRWCRATGQISDNSSPFSYKNTMFRPAIRKKTTLTWSNFCLNTSSTLEAEHVHMSRAPMSLRIVGRTCSVL
jgi:hypothetical protein